MEHQRQHGRGNRFGHGHMHDVCSSTCETEGPVPAGPRGAPRSERSPHLQVTGEAPAVPVPPSPAQFSSGEPVAAPPGRRDNLQDQWEDASEAVASRLGRPRPRLVADLLHDRLHLQLDVFEVARQLGRGNANTSGSGRLAAGWTSWTSYVTRLAGQLAWPWLPHCLAAWLQPWLLGCLATWPPGRLAACLPSRLFARPPGRLASSVLDHKLRGPGPRHDLCNAAEHGVQA